MADVHGVDLWLSARRDLVILPFPNPVCRWSSRIGDLVIDVVSAARRELGGDQPVAGGGGSGGAESGDGESFDVGVGFQNVVHAADQR
jgi:hypothetical protein